MSQPSTPELLTPAASPSIEEGKGWLPVLWDALRGARHDLTAGSVDRAFLLLSVPMVLEMVMESIFALVDVFFVSRLGAEAVATVGMTESMLTFVQTLPMGLSIGATALVARRIGEKDPERAASAAMQSLWLGLLLALPVAVGGILFARPLLSALGASPWVVEHGASYTRVMLGSTLVLTLLFLISAILRGAGDAATSMRALWLANGLNIVLAPGLIFGLGPLPELGVLGAAVATTFGRSVGVLYQLHGLMRGSGRLVIRRRHLRLEPATLLALLRLSGSALVQSLLIMSSWLVLMRLVSSFGSAAMAGYTIAMRILLFAQQPSWGMSHAAGTLVGQSLGARDPERAERAAWRASFHTLLLLGAMALGFLVFAEPLVRAFTSEAEVVLHATRCLRIVSCSMVFYAFGTVLPHAFNGAGDTTTPTVINLLCSWMLQLPLAYLLSRTMGLGPSGVFLAIALGYCALGTLSAVFFRRGRWKARIL
ncbi:MATE family efflux transporter [Archangium violaceum]|uniref:MATE family efflux transporter n=1 Tax=Archangium violaceum TaxID=83451 RepID=UPI00194EEC21|nr:MATE family efflux transporter [Archangium violaceum]QRN93614.1 MATE family efflux transporter [Archangium violaceum]